MINLDTCQIVNVQKCVDSETYLENDGFSFNLRHILEDGIDDIEKFVSIKKTGLIFLEKVNKIVQNKVRP